MARVNMALKPCGYRLPEGGQIDRSQTLRFRFNGRELSGHPGDTLASALLANGVNIVGRSFKYHRPRGLYGAGLEDPNSMLAVRDQYGYEPALRAGQVRLVDGLEVRSVRGWPSPEFDLWAVAQLGARVMSAGFYYKTFKWPNWRLFEPLLRRATGFGHPEDSEDTRTVQHRHDHCDVLVIGGGPAGLAVARMLLGTGLQLVIADDQPTMGGTCLWERGSVDGQPALQWSQQTLKELAAQPGFTVLPSTTVTGAYENNMFTMVQTLRGAGGVIGERHWKLRARHVVLASGMFDRPILFEGNDRPGIMLSSAVRQFINQFGVAPARRLAVYTNNDSGYLTALAAHAAGIEVAAIIDSRPEELVPHARQMKQNGIACHFHSEVARTAGYRRLKKIVVRAASGKLQQIACDGLAISGGSTPTIHLAAHRGCKPVYYPARGMFLCSDLPAGWHAAGSVTGESGLAAALQAAARAARAIAVRFEVKLSAYRPTAEAQPASVGAPFSMPTCGAADKTWVDLQNDVKVSDVALAARENYVSVEHLKRYTTLGMGTDQGRTSNVNGLAVLASLTGREISNVGTTTFRPPYTAVRLDAIAGDRQGDLYHPRRRLPADALHRRLGAHMEDYGWERPAWYSSNGLDRESAIRAEMAAVRERAAIFDASPLGKIEVTGPDAAKFLARFYVSNIATLKPGRIRYSVMLREDGTIFDDGVVTCVAPNHFLAGPTSGNAELVYAWFERWRQTEWPDMQVAVTLVTANWAALAVAGPQAREVLARLAPDFDISAGAFPHMEFREGVLAGVPARVARVSFTGELQYEISVQARYASALLERLLEADARLAPQPVGIEAWLRLRLEKGYLHVGSDTNGRTSPLDIGMGPIVARRPDDFIGKRSLSLSFSQSSEREQLVGLIALDGMLDVGGRVMRTGHSSTPCPTEGYVTSACHSPTLGKSIGLALLERGHSRLNETVNVYCDGRVVQCRVSAPNFYDPNNERLQA